MNKLLKNFSYTLVSNVISFVISAVITFVVPKSLSVEGYGYFQLYMFYISYIGFLHFGWADGLYLRYGGAYYDKLDKQLLSRQFRMYSLVELVLGLAVFIYSVIGINVPDRSFVVCMTGLAVIIVLPKTFFQYLLQCTNRIKEYAVLTITEKIVYVSIVLIVLFFRNTSFTYIIIADVIGKAASCLYSFYHCRDILTSKPGSLQDGIIEAKENITVGIKLMIANVASTLIIGIVRLAIENQWGVSTFGKISLTLSVSNLLMVFIRAVAMVLFPALRRTDPDKLATIYDLMRTALMFPLLGMLVFYYPLRLILSIWLPQYADSLIYMALLFPMCLYECKMSMLIETYLKSLRKEKWLLAVNLGTVGLSVVLTGISVYGLKNLDFAIVSIVVLLGVRSTVAELLLSTSIDITVKKDIVMENLLAIAFICLNWLIGGLIGVLIYAVMYIGYSILKRKDLMRLLLFLKNIKHT